MQDAFAKQPPGEQYYVERNKERKLWVQFWELMAHPRRLLLCS